MKNIGNPGTDPPPTEIERLRAEIVRLQAERNNAEGDIERLLVERAISVTLVFLITWMLVSLCLQLWFGE